MHLVKSHVWERIFCTVWHNNGLCDLGRLGLSLRRAREYKAFMLFKVKLGLEKPGLKPGLS